MQEPIIRVSDIAWIRLQSPDLGRQETFLSDFGLLTSARRPSALYMRGTDPVHHIHIPAPWNGRMATSGLYVRTMFTQRMMPTSCLPASTVSTAAKDTWIITS